ncbi:hypothetical protein ACFLV3_01155 [Chloroflexota bacterium]
MLPFPRRRRENKLYQQWIRSSDLPPGTIRREEVAEEIMPEPEERELSLPHEVIPHEEVTEIPKLRLRLRPRPRQERGQPRQDTAYIVLAIAAVLFSISIIILITQAC